VRATTLGDGDMLLGPTVGLGAGGGAWGLGAGPGDVAWGLGAWGWGRSEPIHSLPRASSSGRSTRARR
jgi:hypothetical protein